MIHIKRGQTTSWRSQTTPLADGQPGYDKERHKLKIGDGKTSWDNLPDASGLRMEEILLAEEDAKQQAKGLLNPVALITKLLKRSGKPIITYGTAAPDKDTVGQVYLQYYDAKPEVDYIVETGVDGIWTYAVYKSGIARCWGKLPHTTEIKNSVGNGYLFMNNTTMSKIRFPLTFKEAPAETVTLATSKNKVAWLASKESCSTTTAGVYNILSCDKQMSAEYHIVFDVKGKID